MGILARIFSKKEKVQEHQHDWEVLQTKYDNRIQVEICEKLGSKHISYGYSSLNWRQRKVCLLCGKCVDEIKDYEKEYEDHVNDQIARKRFANKIWSETKHE